MKIRRSIATALAAGTLLLAFGFASPANARVPVNPDIQINPCVLVPGSCSPTPTVPKGPGDLTQCPPTIACVPPTLPPPVTAPDPTTTVPAPADPGHPATAATPVKAQAAFTG